MSLPMQLTISSPLLVSLAECVHVFCSRGFAEVKVGLRAGASLGIVCPCVLKPSALGAESRVGFETPRFCVDGLFLDC